MANFTRIDSSTTMVEGDYDRVFVTLSVDELDDVMYYIVNSNDYLYGIRSNKGDALDLAEYYADTYIEASERVDI